MSQFDGESKYAHLLKPIRDLTTNWNIDIAHDLEDYLEELESLSIAFDEDTPTPSTFDGANVFNFAEAALLIQGTTCIYSRKVEYLYALVYQTLDHLTQQKNTHASADLETSDPTVSMSSTRRSRKSAATTAASSLSNMLRHIDVEDPDEDVLPLVSLEDLQKLCIDCSVFNHPPSIEDGGVKRTKVQQLQKRNKANFAMGDTNSGHNFQASIALMSSLVPDDHDHGDYFKLQTCQLHEHGALMMDSSMKTLLDANHSSSQDPVPKHRQGMMMSTIQNQFPHPSSTENVTGPTNESRDYGDAMDADNFHPDNDDFGDDDGDDDGGAVTEMDFQDAHQDEHQYDRKGEKEMEEEEEEDWEDPWIPLDSFNAKSAKLNPFRKAATHDKHVLKKVKRMKEKKTHEESLTLSAINIISSFDTSTNLQFVTGPMSTDYIPIWKEKKKKERELWKLMQTKTNPSNQMTNEDVFSDDDEDCNHYDDQGGWVNGGSGDEDDDDDHHVIDTNLISSSELLDGSGAKSMDEDRFSQSMSLNQAFQNVSHPSLSSMSIEDQCRSHYNAFTQGAESYANESDLSKQIATWQHKLIPILEEEDSHPPFDIHDYGDEIVQRLQQQQELSKKDQPVCDEENQEDEEDDENENESGRAKKTKSAQIVQFDQVVEGLNPYEICRIFLASLQLANNGNIELLHGQNSIEQDQVPFQMQLLTTSNCYASIQITTQN